MRTIYTRDGKVLIEKKDLNQVDVSPNLAEVVEQTQVKSDKPVKIKKEALDRPPMRICATGITAGSIGIGTTLAVNGVDLSVSAAIGLVAFYFTMVAKGNHHSSYCLALAITSLVFSIVTLVIKLKQLGWLDWVQFTG